MVGDLFWKRHVDQLLSLAGTKVADDESLAETPKDEHAFPEVIPLRQPKRSEIETSEAQADENHDSPKKPHNTPNLVPVPEPEQPNLSSGPQSQMPVLLKESRIEEPAKSPVAKRYPARVRTKRKRVIEEM